MNVEKMNEFQQKLAEYQKDITETTTSEHEEITVVFNGSVEIIMLKINKPISNEIDTELLIKTINKGIKNVSLKISQGVQIVGQQMSAKK